MTEHNRSLEDLAHPHKIEGDDQTNQFIEELFPKMFEAFMGVTDIREDIMTSPLLHECVLYRDVSNLTFSYLLDNDEDIYRATYAASGKKDRVFGLTKNPRSRKNRNTHNGMFFMIDSPNGVFKNIVDGKKIGIYSITQNPDRGQSIEVNNFAAYEKGVDALVMLGALTHAKAFNADE